MSKGRHRNKLAALALAAMTPIAALSAMLVSPQAIAAPPEKAKSAKCQVRAVDALKEEGGIPKELEFLKEQLEDDEFAAYHKFQLVETKTLKLKTDESGELEFTTGNKIGLTLMGEDESRLKLHLTLTGRDGVDQLLDTKYSIESGGVLLVRAGKIDNGKRFFAIQCAWL